MEGEGTKTAVNDAAQPAADKRITLKLPVRRMDGTPTGEELELDPRLFGLPRNDHVLYLAVKVELANRRQGTHSTLNRALVRGGGRKPWHQKGRGTAAPGPFVRRSGAVAALSSGLSPTVIISTCPGR